MKTSANRGIGLLVSATSAELEYLLKARNPILFKKTSPIQFLSQLPIPVYFAITGQKGIVAAQGQLTFLMHTFGEEAVLNKSCITKEKFDKLFPETYNYNTYDKPRAVAWEFSNISRIFANISQFTQITSNGKYQPVNNVPKGWVYILL